MELVTKLFFQSSPYSRTTNSKEPKAAQDGVKYKRISGSDETTDLKSEFFKTPSVDDILEVIGLRWFHLKLYTILGLVHITHGLEVSTLAIILPSVKSHWYLSALEAGVLTFSLSSGTIIGASFWGWFSDKYGRKHGFVGSLAFKFVFALASAFSSNYYWLWICLFLVGFGMGCNSLIYVMTMELFPPKYRCLFTGLHSSFWTIGFLVSAISSLWLPVIGFRGALAIACLPIGICFIGIAFLPETPHYYLAAGNEQKTLSTLQDIAPELDLANTTLCRDNEMSSSKRADITQLFRSGFWKITLCAFFATFTSCSVYHGLVYTASNIASSGNATSADFVLDKPVHESRRDLYAVMAWMNFPELAIVISVAVGCNLFPIKSLLLAIFVLTILFLSLALFVLNERTVLLVVTILSRSLAMSAITVIFIFTSLLYPTATRSVGVGTCFAVGSIGVVLGPFIFVALFENAYLHGIVFTIVMLLVGFLATALLPSPSGSLT